jgi:hypothetical protein
MAFPVHRRPRPPSGDADILGAAPFTVRGVAVSAVEEIRIKLEHRLRQVEVEIDSLREALHAMAAEAAAHADGATDVAPAELPHAVEARTAPARARTTRRSGRQRSTGTGRRNGSAAPSRAPAPRDRARDLELERRLAETGGMSAVELARETGTDYAEVLERIRELERAGRAREPRA